MAKSIKKDTVIKSPHLLDKMSDLSEATFDNFRILAENSLDAVLLADAHGMHVYANSVASEITGYSIEELTSQVGINQLAAPDVLPKIKSNFKKRLAGKKLLGKYKTVIVHKNGTLIPIELTSAKVQWSSQTGVIVFFKDLSNRKDLEDKKRINEVLKRKTIALEELINHFQIEKDEIKHQIAANINKTIIPSIKRLKSICSSSVVKRLEKLEVDLKEICSPFLNNLEKQEFKLSPREIEICQLIKSSMSTKEIASTLDVSEHTVFRQRKNIRKKLKITAKINLVTYLKSLEEDALHK